MQYWRRPYTHDDSALIVVGVTLEPNLTTALEILLIASGISDNKASISKTDNTNLAYLDDDLSFIDKTENVTKMRALGYKK